MKPKIKHTKNQTMRIFNTTRSFCRAFTSSNMIVNAKSVQSHLVMLKIRCLNEFFVLLLALFDPLGDRMKQSKIEREREEKNRMCCYNGILDAYFECTDQSHRCCCFRGFCVLSYCFDPLRFSLCRSFLIDSSTCNSYSLLFRFTLLHFTRHCFALTSHSASQAHTQHTAHNVLLTDCI